MTLRLLVRGFRRFEKKLIFFENSETAYSDAASSSNQRIPQPQHWDNLKTLHLIAPLTTSE